MAMGDWNTILDRDTWFNVIQDPRVKDWFFASTWKVPATIVVLYLMVVVFGPKFMKDRKPWDMKWTLVAYNVLVILLNLENVIEISTSAYILGYNDICIPLRHNNGPNDFRLLNGLWWCYMSKIIELFDTLFFILRKKSNQLSFLHIYHHASVVMIGWMILKWFPGGSVVYFPLVNSAVHVFMYIYYAISVIGYPRAVLGWKKSVTMIQLAQFVIGALSAVYATYHNCGFPKSLIFFGGLYIGGYVILFGNFYSKTYGSQRVKKPMLISKESEEKPTEVTNGYHARNSVGKRNGISTQVMND